MAEGEHKVRSYGGTACRASTRGEQGMKTYFICVIFLCTISLAVSHAEERWALLVGIDQYADDMITPLKGAVRDALVLRDALVNHAGFLPDNVFCLTSDDEANLPELGNIVTKLEYIASKMGPGDVFLFFFAGHGISIQYGEEYRSYLLAYETDIRSELLLTKTGLWVEEELIGSLRKIESGKVILILDACRNDPGSGRGDEDNVMTDAFERAFRLSRKKSSGGGDIDLRATIYACKTGERAYEYPGLERGLFSVAFEEALSGKADRNEDKKVTLSEVGSYLGKRVPDLLGQTLGGGRKQTPRVVIDGDTEAGDWVFSWTPSRPAQGDTPSLIQDYVPSPLQDHAPMYERPGEPPLPGRSGLAAVSWSLIPGGGQFYNSRHKKGLVLGGLEIIGIGAAIVSHLAYTEAQDKYMDATKITDIDKYRDERDSLYTRRNLVSIVPAAIFLYNVFDAYLGARKY